MTLFKRSKNTKGWEEPKTKVNYYPWDSFEVIELMNEIFFQALKTSLKLNLEKL